MKRGFTLLELMVVIIIIGILATFALPQFRYTKERAIDREAQANVRLIQAAEKIYRMEVGFYFPYSGSESSISTINQNLRLAIPGGTTRNWNYLVYSTADTTATRNVTDGRVWTLNITNDDPTCSGTDCPP